MKHSQASTEFLLILSMILLISLIAVSIISPASIFNFQEKNNRDYWNNAQISLKVSTNDTRSILSIKNNLRLPINITNISLDSHFFDFPWTYIESGSRENILSSTTIYPGSFNVNITYLIEDQKYYFYGNSVKLTVNYVN